MGALEQLCLALRTELEAIVADLVRDGYVFFAATRLSEISAIALM